MFNSLKKLLEGILIFVRNSLLNERFKLFYIFHELQEFFCSLYIFLMNQNIFCLINKSFQSIRICFILSYHIKKGHFFIFSTFYHFSILISFFHNHWFQVIFIINSLFINILKSFFSIILSSFFHFFSLVLILLYFFTFLFKKRCELI